MTFVCLAIVDKLGRKILLITGMIGMSLSSFALATFRILSEKVCDQHTIVLIYLRLSNQFLLAN
jgi:hypothetical protein